MREGAAPGGGGRGAPAPGGGGPGSACSLSARARPGMARGDARLGQSSDARHLCPRRLESWKLSKISWGRWRGRRLASHGTHGGGLEGLTSRRRRWKRPGGCLAAGGWEEGEKASLIPC